MFKMYFFSLCINKLKRREDIILKGLKVTAQDEVKRVLCQGNNKYKG